MDKGKGSLMMKHKALRSRDDGDRLYQEKKEEEGFVGIEDIVDTSIRGFKDYIKKSKERLISASRNSNKNI